MTPATDQPVYSTVTMSSAFGWAVPPPGVMTLVARPDLVFVASAGGAATSGGAGTGLTMRPAGGAAGAACWAGVCCEAYAVMAVAAVRAITPTRDTAGRRDERLMRDPFPFASEE